MLRYLIHEESQKSQDGEISASSAIGNSTIWLLAILFLAHYALYLTILSFNQKD